MLRFKPTSDFRNSSHPAPTPDAINRHKLKHRFRYDDSLDVFGVHSVGRLIGTLLAGAFATAAIGGVSGLIEGNPQQLLIQFYGVAITLMWSAGVTFVLRKLVSAFVPVRVSREL